MKIKYYVKNGRSIFNFTLIVCRDRLLILQVKVL